MSVPSYQIDYVMHTKLDPTEGTDLPIYPANLEFNRTRPFEGAKTELHIRRDKYGEGLNNEKEDYWLFEIHAHDSTIEFAISESPIQSEPPSAIPFFQPPPSQSDPSSAKPPQPPPFHSDPSFAIPVFQPPPVYENSSFNWKNLTDSESYTFQIPSGPDDYPFRISADLAWNRYVAIRCPKTTNPLISVRGFGRDKTTGYAALRATGLYMGHGVDNKHEFISIKTTNRLLPDYAKSIEQYPDWFERDGAVDITNRSLSMYPKQLLGTTGDLTSLYKKFVTCDPANTKGATHFSLVQARIAKGERAPAVKYTWNAERATTLSIVRPHKTPPEGVVDETLGRLVGYEQPPDYTASFNYATGREAKTSETNGLKFILGFFPTMGSLLVNVVSGNVAGAIVGLIGLPVELKKAQEEVEGQADVIGFVTAVVNTGAKWSEEGKKEGEKGKKSAKEEVEREKLVGMLKRVVTTQTIEDEITAV